MNGVEGKGWMERKNKERKWLGDGQCGKDEGRGKASDAPEDEENEMRSAKIVWKTCSRFRCDFC